MNTLEKLDILYSKSWYNRPLSDKEFNSNEVCCENCKTKGFFISDYDCKIKECFNVSNEEESSCYERCFDKDGFISEFEEIYLEEIIGSSNNSSFENNTEIQ